MKKTEAVRIILNAAEEYNRLFLERNFLYIYDNKKDLGSIETYFSKKSFLHLTGVETNVPSAVFFDMCVNHRLSERDFSFKSDGTTNLKMQILPMLFKVTQNYKMLGSYDFKKPKLFTDKIAGGQRCCMGFVKDPNGYYVPNTSLKEDIRDISEAIYRIVAIYSKEKAGTEFSDRLYIAKNVPEATIISYVENYKHT